MHPIETVVHSWTIKKRRMLPIICSKTPMRTPSQIQKQLAETSASNRKLSHQIRCHVKERIGTSDLFLLIPEPLADGMPIGIPFATDHILVSIAFEIDHVIILFELVQLDVDEHPDSIRDARNGMMLRRRGRTRHARVLWG